MDVKRSEPSVVMLQNTRDKNLKRITMHVSVGSWVTMRPKLVGPHAVKKRKIHDVRAHWKAQILRFIFNPSSKKVERFLVAHAYDRHAMSREEIASDPKFPNMEANWLCSSDFQDLVPADSITSVLEVHHISIGKLLFSEFPATILRDAGIWFLKFHYTKKKGQIGRLAPVDLPTLSCIGATQTDLQIITSNRLFITREARRMLTEKGGVRCGVSISLPMKSFAFLFKDVLEVRDTPKTYIIKGMAEDMLGHIFLGDWKTKMFETGGQLTQCTIDVESLVFRYMVPKQKLCCNFYVQRKKRAWKDGKWLWKPVEDHEIRKGALNLSVASEDTSMYTLEVDEDWSLMECRTLLEGRYDLVDFRFVHNERKVGFRREHTIKCGDCMPPNTITIANDV